MEKETAVAVVKDLTDIFKHRHQFYWSTYYKLIFYHMAVVAVPYLVYHFLKTYDFLSSERQYLIPILVLLSWVLCVVNVWLAFRSKAYLKGEDLRLLIVHKAIREIYLKEFGVNLYPDSSVLQAEEKCLQEYNDNQALTSSIGNYMQKLFLYFLAFVSVIGTTLFNFLAYALL